MKNLEIAKLFHEIADLLEIKDDNVRDHGKRGHVMSAWSTDYETRAIHDYALHESNS